jgi:hypothetical protein
MVILILFINCRVLIINITMIVYDVQIEYSVDCVWTGLPPVYRLYVNDELFTERTYIWTDHFLEEIIPIKAPAGEYKIRYELIGNGELKVTSPNINFGPAKFIDQYTIRIGDENT